MTSHGSSQSRGIRLPFIWNGPMGSGALLVALISAAICLQAVALDGLPHTIDAEEGTDVRIPCPQFREIQHPRGIRLVLWFRENETNPITSFDGRGRSRPGELAAGDPDLRLTRVNLGHSGRYRCRVDAEDDPTEVSWVQLTVHDGPDSVTLRCEPDAVAAGSEVTCACHVLPGRTGYKVTWLWGATFVADEREDRQLVSSDRIVAGPQLLIIKNLTPNDTGRYACFANNTLGAGLSNTVNLELKCHSSVLQWTPTTGTDYGRLLCRATNSLGRQLEPCRVDLVPPESGEFSVNSWVLGGAIFALLAVVALVIVSVHVRCHCTPISDVGSCRSSPDRSELLRQRSSAQQQQPIYAASTVDDQAEVHTDAGSEDGAGDAYQDLQDPDTALEETETADEQR
ncbi:Hemicentin-1 [Amphibalanus amphitrite]|uniref:Hemicentin-1 n=1 Tax=Amphibalanus amphitrite TaxID=1232801 RepID=A0A6A4VQQ9_AMPAM|nr:Hemicentin-1 [Amphibalanus amphitrite]